VHSHIDEGLFRRMKFPEFCIAKTVEEYIEALVRLVSDAELRHGLANGLKANRPDKVLYSGAPEKFADIFAELVETG
jgi:predicted O-linked N-acetylglucosamine transferase (SPINDLY family)